MINIFDYFLPYFAISNYVYNETWEVTQKMKEDYKEQGIEKFRKAIKLWTKTTLKRVLEFNDWDREDESDVPFIEALEEEIEKKQRKRN